MHIPDKYPGFLLQVVAVISCSFFFPNGFAAMFTWILGMTQQLCPNGINKALTDTFLRYVF